MKGYGISQPFVYIFRSPQNNRFKLASYQSSGKKAVDVNLHLGSNIKVLELQRILNKQPPWVSYAKEETIFEKTKRMS